jgi:hypothetical protein
MAEGRAGSPAVPTPGAEEFLYWSKERFGGKAVISATHVRIYRPTGMQAVEVVVTSTQVFASHYLDASPGMFLSSRAGWRPGVVCPPRARSRQHSERTENLGPTQTCGHDVLLLGLRSRAPVG